MKPEYTNADQVRRDFDDKIKKVNAEFAEKKLEIQMIRARLAEDEKHINDDASEQQVNNKLKSCEARYVILQKIVEASPKLGDLRFIELMQDSYRALKRQSEGMIAKKAREFAASYGIPDTNVRTVVSKYLSAGLKQGSAGLIDGVQQAIENYPYEFLNKIPLYKLVTKLNTNYLEVIMPLIFEHQIFTADDFKVRAILWLSRNTFDNLETRFIVGSDPYGLGKPLLASDFELGQFTADERNALDAIKKLWQEKRACDERTVKIGRESLVRHTPIKERIDANQAKLAALQEWQRKTVAALQSECQAEIDKLKPVVSVSAPAQSKQITSPGFPLTIYKELKLLDPECNKNDAIAIAYALIISSVAVTPQDVQYLKNACDLPKFKGDVGNKEHFEAVFEKLMQDGCRQAGMVKVNFKDGSFKIVKYSNDFYNTLNRLFQFSPDREHIVTSQHVGQLSAQFTTVTDFTYASLSIVKSLEIPNQAKRLVFPKFAAHFPECLDEHFTPEAEMTEIAPALRM